MRDPREAAAAEAALAGIGTWGLGRTPAPAPRTAETLVVLLTHRTAHILVPLSPAPSAPHRFPFWCIGSDPIWVF